MKCPQCGRQADGKICAACGAAMDGAPAQPAAQPTLQQPAAQPVLQQPTAQPTLQQPTAQPVAGAAACGTAPKNRQPTWLVLLVLFLFWPVGLFLMWRGTSWSKTTKIIVTTVVSVLAALLLSTLALGAWLLVTTRSTAENSTVEKVENALVVHSADEMNRLALQLQKELGESGAGSTMRVRYDPVENSMVIDTTIDGATTMAAYLSSGDAKDSEYEIWASLKSDYCDMSEALKSELADNGYADVSSTINLLNEINQSNVLLNIVDGKILYDAVEAD